MVDIERSDNPFSEGCDVPLPSKREIKPTDPTRVHFLERGNADRFMEHIAEGGSARAYCKDEGLSVLTWMRLIENDPLMAEDYSRALKVRAMESADKQIDIAGMVMKGELSGSEATAAARIHQWVASRGDRDRYAERLPNDTGVVNIDMRGAIIDARARISRAVDVATEVGRIMDDGDGDGDDAMGGDKVVSIDGSVRPASVDRDGDVL